MRSRLEPMKKVARHVCAVTSRFILNWFRAKGTMSSGVVEGFNYNVKLSMRKAYGFRTYEGAEIALVSSTWAATRTGAYPWILLTRHKTFSMNHMGSENKPHRWRVLGRVVLFMFGCALVLAVAAPLMPKLAGRWPEFVLGTIASLWAFALTVLFVRWERLRLADVGEAPGHRSLPHVVFGFLLGLLLVALWASVAAARGYLRRDRTRKSVLRRRRSA